MLFHATNKNTGVKFSKKLCAKCERNNLTLFGIQNVRYKECNVTCFSASSEINATKRS